MPSAMILNMSHRNSAARFSKESRSAQPKVGSDDDQFVSKAESVLSKSSVRFGYIVTVGTERCDRESDAWTRTIWPGKAGVKRSFKLYRIISLA
jgi:hypothetical protein